MTIIEPHIHMYSRTTNDYEAMYAAGIRACLEPSFWLGTNRRYAGTFFDYYQLILEFETVRARRFGIDHFCAISLNPKETEDVGLANEVIDATGVRWGLVRGERHGAVATECLLYYWSPDLGSTYLEKSAG